MTLGHTRMRWSGGEGIGADTRHTRGTRMEGGHTRMSVGDEDFHVFSSLVIRVWER